MKSMKNRLLIGCISGVALLVTAVFAGNLLSLQRWAWNAETSDPRNKGIEVWAYHPYGVLFDEVTFDVRDVSGTSSPADVTRFLLQFAKNLEEREFSRVYLARRGDVRFAMEGRYFRTLGMEFGIQNPIYTIRTMPSNLYHPNGEAAFETWTGGLLGVLGAQIKDVNTFYRRWLLE